jgi:hypothetical protein
MSHAENGVRRGIVSRGGSSFAAHERMRNTVFILMLFGALGCMKKQADGTYKVDTAAAKTDTKKSGDELKADLQKAGEKLKAGAQKVRDSETTKHVEEKAGESLEKAGQKLKEKARH